jgi:uncharacterized membrane protein YphA (DoxX/SURF4 family)
MARFRRSGYKRRVTISRRIARPLLASIFIAEGWDAIRNPAKKAEPVPVPATPASNGQTLLPDDPLTWVRINGAVQVGGGVMLAVGTFPRLASLALIGSIVPTTYAGHRFWEEPDQEKRAQQRTQLLKNLGLLGGLIFSAVDTEGAPSIGWRTRRRARKVTDALTEARAEQHPLQTAAKAVTTGRKAGRRANRAARRAARRANSAAVGVARQAGGVTGQAAKSGVVTAAPYLRHANESAHEMAGEALEVAGPFIAAGLERAGELVEEAFDVAAPYVSAGLERAGDLLARVPDHSSGD